MLLRRPMKKLLAIPRARKYTLPVVETMVWVKCAPGLGSSLETAMLLTVGTVDSRPSTSNLPIAKIGLRSF